MEEDQNTYTAVADTPRLSLRRFISADAPFILELLNSPGWLRFIGDRQVRTEEEARNYLLKGPLLSYHQFGFGLYGVCLKNSREMIGTCGLIRRDGLDGVDMGFAFLPQHAGKGYAMEASEAVMQHAQSEHHLSEILAITLPLNKNSIHLLKKLGFQLQKTFRLPHEAEELLLFKKDL